MDHGNITLALHLVGVLMWVGASFSAGLLAATLDPENAKQTSLHLRGLMRRVATPGLLLAWVGGLGRLVPNFQEVYAAAGWMHTKLALAVVVSGLTGALSARLRRAADGQKISDPSRFRIMGIVILSLAAAIVLLAVLKPGL